MSQTNYIMPGEFEQQSAVWLGWPLFQWYKDEQLDTRHAIAQIVQTLSDYQIVANIMCTNEQHIAKARNWLSQHGYIITSYMHFLPIPQIDIWVRDYGPIFLKDRTTNKLAIASYAQNQWGYSTTTDKTSMQMTALPSLVAKFLGIDSDSVIKTQVVSEGGDRIQNGQGVLLVNRAVEFQRNPDATQEELEAAYKRTLNASKCIWLNAGICEDVQSNYGPIPYVDADGNAIYLYGPQTTGGHLDEFCRFASPNRIILAQVTADEAAIDPIAAVNYERLLDAYRILSAHSDTENNPFEIVRIPTPSIDYKLIQPDEHIYGFLEALRYPDDVIPFPKGQPIHVVRSSSYANYLATNGLIIAPKYDNPDKDSAALDALKTAFPGRDVVQIDPTALNYVGGGIHCVTQQQPVGVVS